jgi:hypothetical protein
MANPFDILPLNLFNLFSTQGFITLQRHYMAILLRIYALAEFNRFGLAREVVIAEIVDYLQNAGAVSEIAAEMAGQADEEPEPASLTGQQSEQDYASYLLRRLEMTGWIEREQHADYSEIITLPDYAFTLLEALRKIQEQKPHEFTGQLYTAHQLITAADTNKDFSPALAITQSYENVRQMVRGLSELNQNIRRYVERATREKDIAELLHLQFDDYSQTLGASYHALKTSDHVSRYRRDIINQLQNWQMDSDWLTSTAGELALQSRLTQVLALTAEKIPALIDMKHLLDGLSALPERETLRDKLVLELNSLDLHSLETLQAEVDLRQSEYNRLHAEAGSLDRKIGSLEAESRALADGDIPRLEREIDQAIQEAEAFLANEQATEDLRGEIDKEYTRRLERQPVEVIRENAERYEGDYQAAETRNRDRLREAKHAYALQYDFGYDDEEHALRYIAERDKLATSELPQYEAQIAHQRSLAEQELVENFIHRLREQIEEARQQLAYLNNTLAQLRFGGERYEFITQPAPGLRAMYDMVMDSPSVLGTSLFESGFRQKHQQAWDLLLERLTANNQSNETLAIELGELQDYRSYLQYDIRIHYPSGDRALLSQINAKKSGGETTTPFYVAMAASFSQAYRLNQPRPSDTIRLALFDEAFSKMDTARTASALKFMREAGLQVLLATPPDKSGSLLPYVDTVCTVVRKNSHAFVVEIDKSEIQQEIEQQAA